MLVCGINLLMGVSDWGVTIMTLGRYQQRATLVEIVNTVMVTGQSDIVTKHKTGHYVTSQCDKTR